MTRITDNYDELTNIGVKVPTGFDISKVKAATEKDPIWIHFGGGNLFRCMQAAQQQVLLEKGLSNKGIILAETWDDGLIEDIYDRYNNRTLDVILKGDGSFDLELIDSVVDAFYVNASEEKGVPGFTKLLDIFTKDSLQLATFTVTEKGYNIKDLSGNFFPPVAQEIISGPQKPASLMGVITAAMLARFKAGAAPIALLSTDNFSHNGDKLKSSVVTIANEWKSAGFVEQDFLDYIDSDSVSFPFSMIDRITPQPSPVISEKLQEIGFEDTEIVKTPKFTVSAAFVNTEVTNYLVVEDNFPNGRPKLEEAGVIFTTREKVDEVERMKVCTCLNPLHTGLAVLGCLLGFDKISQEVKDPDLLKLIEKIGYTEGMPVVTDPVIVNPKQFIDEVINDRLPNPFIPDTPQRIATDTSQKLPIRFGVTVDLYNKNPKLSVDDLEAIPFVYAAWLRYLVGVDDGGNTFERSPDPMLVQLDPIIDGFMLGSTPKNELEKVKPLLKSKDIFGVDLVEVGLSNKVFDYFVELMSGTGKVREVLTKVVQ
ncbi:mannitol dehydrogenase [Actinomycetota bacterium]|nr:mannitol dehydrogenase [Actinomycetota bacterium]